MVDSFTPLGCTNSSNLNLDAVVNTRTATYCVCHVPKGVLRNNQNMDHMRKLGEEQHPSSVSHVHLGHSVAGQGDQHECAADCKAIPSTYALLSSRGVRWLVHIRRIEPERILIGLFMVRVRQCSLANRSGNRGEECGRGSKK